VIFVVFGSGPLADGRPKPGLQSDHASVGHVGWTLPTENPDEEGPWRSRVGLGG
jgi:hypothetical protein